MCEDCLKLAEQVVGNPLAYRRPMTPHEATHGQLDRVQADFDAAEVEVASAAAKVAGKMRAQLIGEVAPLVKAGDVAGLARLTASHSAEMAGALRTGAEKAYKRGIAHIREQHAGKTLQLASPRNPKNAAKYLTDAAALYSQRVADQMAATVRAQAHAAILADEGELAEEAVAAVEKATEGLLVTVATALGREALGMGRQAGFAETAQDILTLTYSALLDNNTCETCAAADGQVYGEGGDAGAVEDGIDATPNPDCDGMAYGNVCRCVMIVEYRLEGAA